MRNRFKQMQSNFMAALSGYIDRPCNYMEIGVFKGWGAKWVLENILTHPDSKYIGIDPWDRRLFGRKDIRSDEDWIGLECSIDELKSIYKHKAEFIKGYSFNVVPTIREKNIVLDACYIDGEHTTKAVLNDFDLVWPMLKKNGILIFDDYIMGNKFEVQIAVDMILKKHRNEIQQLFKNRQVGIKKI